ncbi:hypothetical protein M513_06156, partial [Trichuris suis]
MVSAQVSTMSFTDSPSRHITVVDIYDLAAVIGKDFERLIEQFGSESFAELVPKVISALELLESFAGRNERESQEIDRLSLAVSRLEADKLEKKEGIIKFQQELEQIEENYKAEIRQSMDMVRKLQEENKRLCRALQSKELSPVETISSEEIEAIFGLRDTVDHQRDRLKSVEKELAEKTLEVEQASCAVFYAAFAILQCSTYQFIIALALLAWLQDSTDRLERVNKELARKYKAVRLQGRSLVEEKTELISRLQDAEKAILALQLRLGETVKLHEQSLDPDHVPKFTLAELREVLQEKNSLKARVMELEEELAQLRPSYDSSISKGEEEVLVYGPINREPEEKLYPWKYAKKNSGIRRFFRLITKNSESACSSPRRSACTSPREPQRKIYHSVNWRKLDLDIAMAASCQFSGEVLYTRDP